MRTMDQHSIDRAQHFDRMQQALEDGLQAINAARSEGEADAARRRTRQRLEELNAEFDAAFA